MNDNKQIYDDVIHELGHAFMEYGEFTSIHEGIGVLQEEVNELWDAVQSNDEDDVYDEATQVAAMAMKIMYFLSK